MCEIRKELFEQLQQEINNRLLGSTAATDQIFVELDRFVNHPAYPDNAVTEVVLRNTVLHIRKGMDFSDIRNHYEHQSGVCPLCGR